MDTIPLWPWIVFNVVIALILAVDLGVFRKVSREVEMKEAGCWTLFWVLCAIGFNILIYFWRGPQPALDFFTGYLIEESLSIDNIFIFVVVFSFFKTPCQFQHRVLFWGVIGALTMRALLISVGIVFIEQIHWSFYLFGIFLVLTALKFFWHRHEEPHLSENILLQKVKSFLPMTKTYHQEKFFVRSKGKILATPLFLVLLTIEGTDLIFAVDSIPAIFAITRDPFIVYTSNALAVLGLRSMYFLLAGVVKKFYYLRHALSFILGLVGTKMLLMDVYPISTWLSLSLILVAIVIAIIASYRHESHAK
ncbi:MAG: TerC family protein [Alphaproteobacteria bacterium]|jgi:tellurite resistance protein TerC|nr:TerC family protein [Alphaproteobacteria bacterium]MBT5389180.1 TerC family protein [Alphaproteobacteria bacterium]MBT5540463.1 TerC family protein [Alphaproteobacteria bacterium]MBT5654708.1 TerC family protein [Alphaproteobacteria bacterium]